MITSVIKAAICANRVLGLLVLPEQAGNMFQDVPV